jgi:hypothetical protein
MAQNYGMQPQQFSTAVLVNGSQRRLQIDGHPLGRTVILVDGVTAYDKKPFVHRETIAFDILPGKKATFRWQQVSLTRMECDVTVDGRTTTLTAVARNRSSAKPVGAARREDFKVRVIGAGLLALAAAALVLNYFEIQTGSYYPKYLVVTPLLLVAGLVLLTNPRLDLGSSSKKKAFAALSILLLVGGWFFEGWFLSTFAAH